MKVITSNFTVIRKVELYFVKKMFTYILKVVRMPFFFTRSLKKIIIDIYVKYLAELLFVKM